MEKRLEGVKKQAEAIARLEADLAKSRRQERAYEEANEVLQHDLDNMEQELDKLKQAGPSAETQGQLLSRLGNIVSESPSTDRFPSAPIHPPT